jgi:hypothetical protein
MGMEAWYFTFGVSYYHKNDIIKIFGSSETTRIRMKELFGDHWAFQYPEREALKLIEKYYYNVIEVE